MNAYRISGISAEARKSGWVDVTANDVVSAVSAGVPQLGFTPTNLTVMFLKEMENNESIGLAD